MAPADGFRLTMTGTDGATAQFAFTGMEGHTYAVQAASGLDRWTGVPFAVVAGGRLPEAARTSPHNAELDRSFEAGGRSAGDGYTANEVLGEWAGAQAYAAGGAGFTHGFVGDLAPIPAAVVFPGTPGEYDAPRSTLTLAASSSALLPTLFAVISGPGLLAGDVMEYTGPGLVIVAAELPGGVDCQRSAVVTNSYPVTPTPILRIVSGGSPAGGIELEVGADTGVIEVIQPGGDLKTWATLAQVGGRWAGIPVVVAVATGAGSPAASSRLAVQ